MKEKKIKCLLVEPGKVPKLIELENDLTSKQKAVGGYIEFLSPFHDNVAIICNEEGKIEGLPLNRGVVDEKYGLYDVIAGSFLVVGLSKEYECSLTPAQINKYMYYYQKPQSFICTSEGIIAYPSPPEIEKTKYCLVAVDKKNGDIVCIRSNGLNLAEKEANQICQSQNWTYNTPEGETYEMTYMPMEYALEKELISYNDLDIEE